MIGAALRVDLSLVRKIYSTSRAGNVRIFSSRSTIGNSYSTVLRWKVLKTSLTRCQKHKDPGTLHTCRATKPCEMLAMQHVSRFDHDYTSIALAQLIMTHKDAAAILHGLCNINAGAHQCPCILEDHAMPD